MFLFIINRFIFIILPEQIWQKYLYSSTTYNALLILYLSTPPVMCRE